MSTKLSIKLKPLSTKRSASGEFSKIKQEKNTDNSEQFVSILRKKQRIGRPTKSLPGGDGQSEKLPEAEISKLMFEQYQKYADNIEEWKKLKKETRVYIVRCAGKFHINAMKCLSSRCDVKLNTVNGLSYHLERCGDASKKICPHCLDEIVAKRFKMHLRTHIKKGSSSDFQTESVKDQATTSKQSSQNGLTCVADAENGGIEVMTDLDESDSGDEPQNVLAMSQTQKTYAKKHTKKYRFLSEDLKLKWMKRVKEAYDSLMLEHFSKSTFEDLKASPSLWSLADETQLELIKDKFQQRSMAFCTSTAESGQKLQLDLFESMQLDRDSFVGFCGGTIISTAWCPMPSSSHDKQYLAVCTHTDRYLETSVGDGECAIQIWSLEFPDLTIHQPQERLKLEFVILHNYGMTTSVMWCPSGAFVPQNNENLPVAKHNVNIRPCKAKNAHYPRLGLLAATTGVGDILVFSVPHPTALKTKFVQFKTSGKFPGVLIEPSLVLAQESVAKTDLASFCVHWSLFDQHDIILAGFSDGSVSVWNLENRMLKFQTYRDTEKRLLPSTSFRPSSTPVTTIELLTPSKVLLACLDWTISLWDINNNQCVWSDSSVNGIHFYAPCGPIFPAFVYAYDTFGKTRYSTFFDITTRLGSTLTQLHYSRVWTASVSYHHGSILSGDNEGLLCVSSSECFGSESMIRNKFVEKVALSVSALHVKSKKPICKDKDSISHNLNHFNENFMLYVQFPAKSKNTVNLGKISNKVDEDVYPGQALFSAAWNQNPAFSSYYCTGGDAGFLFVSKI